MMSDKAATAVEESDPTGGNVRVVTSLVCATLSFCTLPVSPANPRKPIAASSTLIMRFS